MSEFRTPRRPVAIALDTPGLEIVEQPIPDALESLEPEAADAHRVHQGDPNTQRWKRGSDRVRWPNDADA